MLIGDKKILIDIQLDSAVKSEGKLFLYINGTKFGRDSDNYDVRLSVKNIIDCFSVSEHDYQNLFTCPASILFDAYNQAIDKNLWLEEFDEQYFYTHDMKCSIDKYYPNFMKNYALNSYLDFLYFRLGQYTFDFEEIYTIPSNDGRLRLLGKNQQGEIAEAITTPNEFISIWREVLEKLNATR